MAGFQWLIPGCPHLSSWRGERRLGEGGPRDDFGDEIDKDMIQLPRTLSGLGSPTHPRRESEEMRESEEKRGGEGKVLTLPPGGSSVSSGRERRERTSGMKSTRTLSSFQEPSPG